MLKKLFSKSSKKTIKQKRNWLRSIQIKAKGLRTMSKKRHRRDCLPG